tara:strand:- start:3208 stop:4392 length:1185 start_codon:yes stop_codon:yes gene_type:complete
MSNFAPATITPQQAVDVAVNLAWPMRTKLMLIQLGFVGQGKTVSNREASVIISEKLGRTKVNMRDLNRAPTNDEFFYWEINCSTSDRSDFQIPWISGDSYELVVLKTFDLIASNPDAHGMIVLDEIAKNIELAPIFAEIARERRFGTNFKLPDNVMVVGTGNRSEDNASSFDLPEDLSNRAMICDVESTSESFLEHEGSTLDPILTAAITFMGNTSGPLSLFDYGQKVEPSASRQKCTFRSMSCFNDVISLKPDGVGSGWDWKNHAHRHAGAGLIGTGSFGSISACQDFGTELNLINTFWDDPEGHRSEIVDVFQNNSLGVKNQSDMKYALMVGFLNKIKTDKNNFDNACAYLDIVGSAELTRAFLECAKQIDIQFAKTSRYAHSRAADLRKNS